MLFEVNKDEKLFIFKPWIIYIFSKLYLKTELLLFVRSVLAYLFLSISYHKQQREISSTHFQYFGWSFVLFFFFLAKFTRLLSIDFRLNTSNTATKISASK